MEAATFNLVLLQHIVFKVSRSIFCTLGDFDVNE